MQQNAEGGRRIGELREALLERPHSQALDAFKPLPLDFPTLDFTTEPDRLSVLAGCEHLRSSRLRRTDCHRCRARAIRGDCGQAQTEEEGEAQKDEAEESKEGQES